MNSECEMPTCTQLGDIQQIKNDVSAIKSALLGNEFTENKGMIHRLATIENEYLNEKKSKSFRLGFAAGIGSIFGTAITIILFILGKK